MKLNLGCWHKNYGKDWIHIDKANFPHVHSHDIVNLPYDNNSVDVIYASHVLEYFDRVEAINVLSEWKRVLKKGGKLMVAVPNFKALVELYQKGYPIEMFEGSLFGRMFADHNLIYHKIVYDLKSLKSLLMAIGFRNIKKFKPIFDDYTKAKKPKSSSRGIQISLNLECVK